MHLPGSTTTMLRDVSHKGFGIGLDGARELHGNETPESCICHIDRRGS